MLNLIEKWQKYQENKAIQAAGKMQSIENRNKFELLMQKEIEREREEWELICTIQKTHKEIRKLISEI